MGAGNCEKLFLILFFQGIVHFHTLRVFFFFRPPSASKWHVWPPPHFSSLRLVWRSEKSASSVTKGKYTNRNHRQETCWAWNGAEHNCNDYNKRIFPSLLTQYLLMSANILEIIYILTVSRQILGMHASVCFISIFGVSVAWKIGNGAKQVPIFWSLNKVESKFVIERQGWIKFVGFSNSVTMDSRGGLGGGGGGVGEKWWV